MRHWTAVLLSVLLSACAATPVAQLEPRFFHDRLFAAATEPVGTGEIFALSAEMRRYIDEEIAVRARRQGRQLALVDALFTKGELKLEYDSARTRNAAEAFAARSGNCLSLVIMTAALAKAVDLPVEYQKAIVEDAPARAGDIYLAIGHVNLTLGRRKTDDGGFGYRVGRKPRESEGMMIDFLPPADLRGLRTRPIGEDVVVGMYLNNRAVEALARGEVDNAYWWAREAVIQSPSFPAAYNTLAVVYRHHGNASEAEPVLRHVLEHEPDNTLAMSNLVVVLADLGRNDESQRLAARLKQIDPEPPFSHFKRGMEALRAGDPKAAKEAFAKEIARAPDYHEFHFWLASAHLALGESDAARRHLALAMKNSTTRRDHDLYAAKLERLNQSH